MSARIFIGTLALGLLLASGCASDSATSTVEIYSWWETGSETAALDALLAQFGKENPNATVVNAAAANAPSAQSELQSRMHEGDPPDTFQVNGGAQLRQYVTDVMPSQLEALDFLATSQKWKKVIPLDVLQTVMFGTHFYAVPVDIARVNALFYNKAIFNKFGQTPPVTIADFVHVSQVFAANDVPPLAIGDQLPWALEVIFKGCLAAQGADYYKEFAGGTNPYFAGTADPAVTGDPAFDRAVSDFGTILAYANTGQMRDLTWDQAVALVAGGSAAMTLMGDWAHGELLQDHGQADVTFGEVAAPGSSDTFIFTTDTFVLPIGAKNRDGAVALLTAWGSAAGQSAFYPPKGSLPSRSDVDPSGRDSISDWTIQEFASRTHVADWALAVPQAFSTNFDPALDRFADDGNAENVVLAARNNYDLIVHGQ
jgi:glucose/mannose transport system substrate-binding protein